MELKTSFDGRIIAVPEALRQLGPTELTIVVSESAPPAPSQNWRQFVGKASQPRSVEDIVIQVRADRDEWDQR